MEANFFLQYFIKLFSDIPSAVWRLIGINFINRCGSMLLFFISIYLASNFNFTKSNIGIVVSTYGIGSILGSYLGGVLCARLSPFVVQLTSLFASGILFLSLEHIETFPFFILIMILIGTFLQILLDHKFNSRSIK